jgi:hypothetical protein
MVALATVVYKGGQKLCRENSTFLSVFLSSGLPTHRHNYCKMIEFANEKIFKINSP